MSQYYLLNFEYKVVKKNIVITINPKYAKPKAAAVFSPDGDGKKAAFLNVERKSSGFEITVPELSVYSVIKLK